MLSLCWLSHPIFRELSWIRAHLQGMLVFLTFSAPDSLTSFNQPDNWKRKSYSSTVAPTSPPKLYLRDTPKIFPTGDIFGKYSRRLNLIGLDRDVKCWKTKDQKILPMFEKEKILFAQFCIFPKLKDFRGRITKLLM